MKNNQFCHLHVHNEYSYLDGFGSADKYAKKAKELGFEYLSITNHGNIDGVIQFQKACQKHSIKPIIGVEAYIVRDIAEQQKGEKRGHICFLVKNQKGWNALCSMLTIANLDGFYYVPRLDYRTVLDHDLSGLVITSACLLSFLNIDGGIDFAKKIAKKTDFYLEAMPHDSEEQKEHNLNIAFLHGKYNWPVIATNDCHYPNRGDDIHQEVLLAVQRKAKWNDKDRWRFETKGLYLKSADEMLLSFKRQGTLSNQLILQAIKNTLTIAKKCSSFEIKKRDITLPKAPIQSNDPIADIRRLIKKPLSGYPIAYKKRSDKEIALISKKNFGAYFLIVRDFIDQCNQNGIATGPGRGSVGGSLIAFLLGITKVDPIKHNLSFSRFISEDRVDYPDIDIDVEKRNRQEAIQILSDTYGEDNICGIASANKMQTKGAIRDVARVFEVPGYEVNELIKALWNDDLETAIENKTPEVLNFQDKYPEVIDHAIALDGTVRGRGQHAAGIILSKNHLREENGQVVLVKGKGKSGQVASWSMDDAEYMGLIKLDVLGLATLSVIKEAETLIGLSNSKYEVTKDSETFKMINQGQTQGLFQLSGKACKEVCQEMKVENFEDIVAILSIARTGPQKAGVTSQYIKRRNGAPVVKVHPIYDKITAPTYGLIIYQEQLTSIISLMAGVSKATADKIRKIIAKKRDKKELEKYKKQFINGCAKKKTFNKKQAEKFWADLEGWAEYGFNRSHAVEYATIAMTTAYLKCNYPGQFFAATLTYGEYNEKSRDPGKHKQSVIDQAIESSFEIKPPTKEDSHPSKWIIDGKELFCPFSEIKGIGDKQAQTIFKRKRKSSAPKNTGFFGLGKKVTQPKENKIDKVLKEIENLTPEIEGEYFSFKFKGGDNDTDKNSSRRNNRKPRPRSQRPSKITGTRTKNKPTPKTVSECNKCGLRSEATVPIESSRGLHRIGILAEAPGRDEDRGIKLRSGKITRMNLIGPAGNVLWDELKKYGLSRKMFYVMNTCRCYPSKSKTPNDIHIANCWPWTIREIEKNNIQLLLAMGNIPLKALTGQKGGIQSISGSVGSCLDLKIKVVWCVHPSSVLRNRTANYPYFKKGIETFVNEVKKKI